MSFQPQIRLLTVAVWLALLTFTSVVFGEQIVAFKLRAGTLQFDEEKKGWIFRSGGEDEFYDASNRATWFSERMPGNGPVPGLIELGVRTQSGQLIYFDPTTDTPVKLAKLYKEYVQSHPQDRVRASVFGDVTGNLVVVNKSEVTPLLRLDADLRADDWTGPTGKGDIGDTAVIWRNFQSAERVRLSGHHSSCQIQTGTLSTLPKPKRGYLFRAKDAKEEPFALHAGKSAGRGKTAHLLIPGLQEIGFKLSNGAEYYYETSAGERTERATLQAALVDAPGATVVAHFFRGEANSRVVIPVEGQTPVIRAVWKMGARTFYLWKNDEAAESVR